MPFEIGEVDMHVRVIDDRSRLDPTEIEGVVREVLRRLRDGQGERARHDDDTGVWSSVREGQAR